MEKEIEAQRLKKFKTVLLFEQNEDLNPSLRTLSVLPFGHMPDVGQTLFQAVGTRQISRQDPIHKGSHN